MTYAGRLLCCAAISAAAHALLARAQVAPARREPPRVVTVRVVPPPPPPPPPEPPPPAPPPPEVHEAPRPTPKPPRPVARPTPSAPTPSKPSPTEPSPSEHPTPALPTPVYGVSMQSTSQGGTTSAPVGNTLRPDAPRAATPGPVEGAPVGAQEVTAMPVPLGRCTGTYTDEARAAGTEGTVVLDLVVGADGATSDVKVVQGLDHGLTEAAVAAARACRFRPGERAGQKVPVRIRGFKIRFFLGND